MFPKTTRVYSLILRRPSENQAKAFMDWHAIEVLKHANDDRGGLDRTSLFDKGFRIRWRAFPSGRESSISRTRVANHSTGFGPS